MFHGLCEILLDRCVSLLFHGLFLGDCSIADKLTPARTGSIKPRFEPCTDPGKPRG
jgi:hypothetical protein